MPGVCLYTYPQAVDTEVACNYKSVTWKTGSQSQRTAAMNLPYGQAGRTAWHLPSCSCPTAGTIVLLEERGWKGWRQGGIHQMSTPSLLFRPWSSSLKPVAACQGGFSDKTGAMWSHSTSLPSLMFSCLTACLALHFLVHVRPGTLPNYPWKIPARA